MQTNQTLKTPDLTLIVPCYNEAGNIPCFYRSATSVFREANVSLELVFIDDGSADDTLSALHRLARTHDHDVIVQVISFSRNFGKESGLYAGLQAARGRIVGLIDADMQQDPKIACQMYHYLQEHNDCDVVAAYQEERHERRLLRWSKHMFYRTFNAASDEIDIPADMSDFRLFRHDVATALLSMPEYFRFSKGLFAWVGFRTHAMPYTPHQRHSGTSSWSFSQLFHYAMGGILAFTTWPLKIAKWTGVVSALGALIYLLYVVIVDYGIKGIAVPGYPTLVCLILLLGGVQLLVLGIIGEYLARDYLEGKHRPLYIARERIDSAYDDESVQESDDIPAGTKEETA